MSFVDGAGLLQWTARTGEETLAFLEQNIRVEPGDPYCSFESILQMLKPFPAPPTSRNASMDYASAAVAPESRSVRDVSPLSPSLSRPHDPVKTM